MASTQSTSDEVAEPFPGVRGAGRSGVVTAVAGPHLYTLISYLGPQTSQIPAWKLMLLKDAKFPSFEGGAVGKRLCALCTL